MPELPEVENVALALRHCLLGRRLTGMRVRFGGVLEPSAAMVRRTLVGRSLSAVDRQGKYLRLEFAAGTPHPTAGTAPGSPRYLTIHLRMTGQLFIDPDFRPDKHTHLVLDFDGLSVFYRDIRKFGRLTLLPVLSGVTARARKEGEGASDPARANKAGRAAESSAGYGAAGVPANDATEISGAPPPARTPRASSQHPVPPPAAPPHVGRDMLEISFAAWHAQVAKRRAPIKAVLLDQRVASGLGNIYADEALHRARVHPTAPAAALDELTLRGLFRAARAVLRLAIRHGGTTYLNFVDFHGQPGNFRRKLRVYQRTGEPCATCGEAIERLVVGGRSSHFCPCCQPEPAGRDRRATRRSKR